MTNCKKLTILGMLILGTTLASAQNEVQHYTLTLEGCRQMAIDRSKELSQARIQVEMAGYDRKIAMANYFPKVTAGGAYIYNNRDVKLISDQQSQMLTTAGTQLDNAFWSGVMGQLSTLPNEVIRQTAIGLVSQLQASPDRINIAAPINAIGAEVDAALHPNLHNIWAGGIIVEQPVFVGGKIVYSNQMASLAEKLAKSQYEMKESDILLDVDEAYWQIISIANKKKLAESYADLLHHLENDVNQAVQTGVSTQADALEVKVKVNEADMMLTKATNGLMLSKMLLCQRVGLPLDSEISLADEALEVIPTPVLAEEKSLEDIYTSRPETRSLELAGKIYEIKAKVVRADVLPTVALMGAFTLTNPNVFDGFQNSWQGGNLSAGVVVKVPIVHGGEGIFKYKKAKAEARLYEDKLSDAKDMICLQVTRQRKLYDEAGEKLRMAQSNLDVAEENLRMATIGHEAGVIPTNTALAAHTAWLNAHSECIDAGIELQMSAARLRKAEGTNE